jgi:hypothetical protein
MSGGGVFHGCIHAGCAEFGAWGRKRRKPDGQTVIDWWCRAHRPDDYFKVSSPMRGGSTAPVPAAVPAKGQGRLL